MQVKGLVKRISTWQLAYEGAEALIHTNMHHLPRACVYKKHQAWDLVSFKLTGSEFCFNYHAVTGAAAVTNSQQPGYIYISINKKKERKKKGGHSAHT